MDPDPACLLLSIAFGSHQIIILLVMVIALFCTALLSGVEVSLFSLTPIDFQDGEDKFSSKQEIIIDLLDKPKRLLATILIAGLTCNLTFVLLFDRFGDFLFGQIHTVVFGVDLKFVLKVVVTTFLILLFGEILPKIYANRNRVAFSMSMAYPMYYLDRILRVFTAPMTYFTQKIHHGLGGKASGLSVDRLSQALELTDKRETTQQEQKILRGIVSFGNTDTKQVMCPRTDIFSLSVDQPFKEIIPEIIDHGFSRIPVCGDSLDEVKGILYVKDLLPYLDEDEFAWQGLIRSAYFVPENKKLDDLLNEFKDKKNHLAIVVDEYGGTSGLLSMEDIMEEIVGEISDEFDDDDLTFSKLDEKTYIFDGKTSLVDFYRIAKIRDSNDFEGHKGDSETVAGFLLEILGGLPARGEKINFGSYTFTIEAVDEKRIKQIKFSKA